MKEAISTNKAPGAIGPYSQAIKAGDALYVSGQIPVNPETGAIGETIEEQAAQSLTNLKNILEANGMTTDNVVKRISGSKPKHSRLMTPALYRFIASMASSRRGFISLSPSWISQSIPPFFPCVNSAVFFRWSKEKECGIVRS